MKNLVLEDIKNYAIRRLNEAYGYCGAAMGEDMALLNSDDRNGSEIRISITSKPE